MPAGKAPKEAPQASPASSGDRISALPDEMLHRVLSFLPAQQAVRTCVLARRWRHLWKSAPSLSIVGIDGKAPVLSADGKTPVLSADGKAPVLFEEIREFMDGLLLRRGDKPGGDSRPRLEKFDLRVAGAAIDLPHVWRWVMYAVECKVQLLRLVFHGISAWLQLDFPPLASEHLTHLELSGLVLNNDVLDFSRCPQLQHLKIILCNLEHAERISSQSLRYLTITTSRFNRSSRARILAPNLYWLELGGIVGRTPVLQKMPLLDKAVVAIYGLCRDCWFGKDFWLCNKDFLHCKDCCSRSNYGDCGDGSCGGCIQDDCASVLLDAVSQAKSLLLIAHPETFIFRRDLKLRPIFNQLKRLILNENWCVPDEHPMACILEHSPVLEDLVLWLDPKMQPLEARVTMVGMFNPKELPPTISSHLKRVRIICAVVDGNGRVLKVLQFLSKLNISFSFPS